MFNKDMLVLARELRGYTQKELVSQLDGITQGHLSKLEAGIHTISEDNLKQISKVLNLPVKFFYQQKQHYGLPLSINGNFRKRQSLSKKSNLKIRALINVIIHNIEDLILNKNDFKSALENLNINYENTNLDEENLKELNVNNKKEIQKIVSSVKKVLGIDLNKPVDNLIEILEKNNILVIDLDFGTSLVDGFSYWVQNIPVIFVSKNITGDRQRFTVAHELGHLLLHKNTYSMQIETEANYFASEFLMPSDIIKKDFGIISIEKLAILKSKWKVSMAALLMKAKELNLINKYTYVDMFVFMSKLGYRNAEPVTIDTENTKFIKELICKNKQKLPLNNDNIQMFYGV